MVTLHKRKGLLPKLNFSGGVAYSGRSGDADAVSIISGSRSEGLKISYGQNGRNTPKKWKGWWYQVAVERQEVWQLVVSWLTN